jgi:hypothetical protein
MKSVNDGLGGKAEKLVMACFVLEHQKTVKSCLLGYDSVVHCKSTDVSKVMHASDMLVDFQRTILHYIQEDDTSD